MISPESFVLYFLLMGVTGLGMSIYIVYKGTRPWWGTLVIMFGLVLFIGLASWSGTTPIPHERNIWAFIVFMPWLLTMYNTIDLAAKRSERKAKDVEAEAYRSCVAKRNQA